MDKFLYLISEGLKNVWRHKMTTFTAVFSLFLALYFVGLLATVGENTKSILQYLRSKYKIEVFFKQNIDLKVAKEVSDLILEIKGVRSSNPVHHISQYAPTIHFHHIIISIHLIYSLTSMSEESLIVLRLGCTALILRDACGAVKISDSSMDIRSDILR